MQICVCVSILTYKFSIFIFSTFKALLQAMLNNQVDPQPHMSVTEGCGMMTMGLQCLVAHFTCVMQNVEQDKTLLTPLLALSEGNQTVKVRIHLIILI